MEYTDVACFYLQGALARYPNETIDYFISENQLKDSKAARFMAYMLKESTIIREAFKNKIEKVVLILNSAHNQIMAKHGENETNPNLAEIQFSCISLVHLLVKLDRNWLKDQASVINALKNIWNQDMYHDR